MLSTVDVYFELHLVLYLLSCRQLVQFYQQAHGSM